MGFGLKELKLLRYTLREIDDANNNSIEDAVKKLRTSKSIMTTNLDLSQRYRYYERRKRKLKLLADISSFLKLYAVVIKLLSIDGSNNYNSVEGLNLLADKVRVCGGIKAAIEKLSSQPIVDAKSLVLSNNDKSTKSSVIEEIV